MVSRNHHHAIRRQGARPNELFLQLRKELCLLLLKTGALSFNFRIRSASFPQYGCIDNIASKDDEIKVSFGMAASHVVQHSLESRDFVLLMTSLVLAEVQ